MRKEAFGALVKQLIAGRSFREMQRLTGVDRAIVANMSEGIVPHPATIARFAEALGANPGELLESSGFRSDFFKQAQGALSAEQEEVPESRLAIVEEAWNRMIADKQVAHVFRAIRLDRLSYREKVMALRAAEEDGGVKYLPDDFDNAEL